MTHAIRSSNWFRPMKIDGIELEKIIFFGDGKELLSVDRGWLEAETDRAWSARDVVEVEIPVGTVKKNKD